MQHVKLDVINGINLSRINVRATSGEMLEAVIKLLEEKKLKARVINDMLEVQTFPDSEL